MYKVVIAEDERRVQESIRSIIEMEDCGFQVVGETSNGLQALALTDRFKPDLLITDICMPDLNGFELVREIKERNYRCDVVLLSGYNDFTYAQQAIRLGIVNYLLKPLDPGCLLETLYEVRGKLQKTQNRIAERLDWVRSCDEAAKRMAEQIWHLNEPEAERELSAFIEAHLSDGTDPLTMIEKGLSWISFLADDFNKRGFPQSARFRQFWTNDPDEIAAFLHTYIAETLDNIKKSRNFGQSRIVREALSYIEQHYSSEALSLEKVSGLFDMSPSYFSYLFKQEKGISFIHYVTRLRMEKAKKLLNDPYIKVYEAGHAVGYMDYAHFAKVFKKHCSLTPSEYRHHACAR